MATKPNYGLFVLPAIAMLGLLFVVPLAWFFVRTLVVDSNVSTLPAFTWQTLTAPPIRSAILATNVISLVVTLVVLVIGYPVAFFLTTSSRLKFLIVLFCVLVPYFISIIVRTYSWMILLGSSGIVNQLLIKLGLISSPLSLLYNKGSIVVGMVYVLLPYMVLTLYAAMKAIDLNLIRAGLALGGTAFYVFRRVYLPLSLHAILSGSLIVFILSIGFFITPTLLGGPSDVLIAMLIERAVDISFDWRQAAIVSLFLLLVTLALYALYCRVGDMRKLLQT
jgi:putative spermidine/putrescine transport system permease protein